MISATHMAGTHKKRMEDRFGSFFSFDEDSERYCSLSCIIIILNVPGFLFLSLFHHNLLFTERFITTRLYYILDYSNSEDISLDELEEELKEHKNCDVSQWN